MISEKKYYEHLYARLIGQNGELFAGCDGKNLEKIPMPEGKYSWLYKLLDQVEDNYGFNLQKMCVPNYNKFILWQKNFMEGQLPDALDTAIQFVIFCCLADKILDSGRFDAIQKEAVCEKLHANHFLSSETYVGSQFPEMDVLLNNIRTFLFLTGQKNRPEQNEIAASMEKAFLSEIYMWKSPLQQKEGMKRKELYLLSDKSVQFELASFLIASFGQNSEKSHRVALEVANIFWLIDDLCDLIEDIKAKRKNSLLFYGVHTEEQLSLLDRAEETVRNMDGFVGLLEENLNFLKQDADAALFEYVVNEVWDWCTELRNRAV